MHEQAQRRLITCRERSSTTQGRFRYLLLGGSGVAAGVHADGLTFDGRTALAVLSI
jgi:hypothetical protein